MLSRRMIPVILVFVAMLCASIAAAAQASPTIVGPESGAAGDYLTYFVGNPANLPLSIRSSTGLWVRSIATAQPTTDCSLDDGGTEDIVTCDGDFRVTVSSDLGQQIILQIGQATMTISVSGEHPVQNDSQVHIYNGLVPAAQSLAQSESNPPATTNVLLGEYTSYRLAALNFSSNITHTFDITLTVPSDVLVTKAPRDCTLRETGIYRCSFVVGPQDWKTSGFEVKWVTAGIKALTAKGTINGVQVGKDTRLGNVIVVSSSQLFFPVAKK